MKFQYDDGGRKESGISHVKGDCVTRSIATATGLSYKFVYHSLNEIALKERVGKRKKGVSHASTGVYKYTVNKFLSTWGWTWHPTMFVGSGCKVHLNEKELPSGTLIVRVSKHMVTVINHTIYDLSDCSRKGKRCVYGYWQRHESCSK